MSLQNEMTMDLAEIQSDLGNPSFVWKTDNNTYRCIASLALQQYELSTGGFGTRQTVTMTIPRYNSVTGNPTFPNDTIPVSQQRIVFANKSFRVENVKTDTILDTGKNGARIRILAVEIVKGV